MQIFFGAPAQSRARHFPYCSHLLDLDADPDGDIVNDLRTTDSELSLVIST